MTGKRKVLLIVFIFASAAAMWGRYAYEKERREKMQRTLDELAQFERERTLSRASSAEATPAPTVEETRDMFASDLPRERLEAIRQAVGQDFKLMEIYFSDLLTTATVSTDGKTVRQFQISRYDGKTQGPNPVNLLGDAPLSESLYDVRSVNLALIPKLAKDALTRAGLDGGRVTGARFAYSLIRYKGETPEWTVMVERGTAPPDWEH